MSYNALKRIILTLDAMNPEFKKANDILLKAIRLNDRTDGVSHLLLEKIGKAFKANDAKAASDALSRLLATVTKAAKGKADAIKAADAELVKATEAANKAKEDAKKAKAAMAVYDKAIAAANAAKTDVKKAARLAATFDRYKAAIGDFGAKTAKISQMVAQKKDATKQIEMLAKAVDAAKKKAAKNLADADKALKMAADKMAVKKEMAKIARNKSVLFDKEQLLFGQLRAVLPSDRVTHSAKESGNAEGKRTTASFITGKSGRIGYGTYLSVNGSDIVVEIKSGTPWPYILDKGTWMEIPPPVGSSEAYVPEGSSRFKPEGGMSYLVWGKRKKRLQ